MNEPQAASMTREQRLLLALLSAKSDDRPSSQDGIRWNDFLRLVGGLYLAPFAAYLLQEDCRGFPDSVRNRIVDSGRANTMRQMRRHAALRRIAQSLEQAHIPLIILKGMALAYLAYPNPYCRFMADIDLLVPRADLERAAQLSRDCGFHESRDVSLMECLRPETEHRESFVLLSSDGLAQVEIHAILPSLAEFGIDSASLWDRSVAADLGGVQVRVLCPEDFIQHLCLHIGPFHYYLSRLQGLLDFRFYLEKHSNQIDWQTVSDRSLQNGTSPWVYLTLWLARELVGAPVPADFFQICPAPKYLSDLSQLATHHLLYVSTLPMTSNFVKLFAARSFGERWNALAQHWSNVGSRAGGSHESRTSTWTWLRDYFKFVLHRLKFYVQAGTLRPSVWSAAADYQASRARLLHLMESEAHVLPPHRPAV
jgi:hypothetical protein